MFLIIGLGNPEEKYNQTPHNAGFLVLDKIAQNLNLGGFKEKFLESLFIKTSYKDCGLILVKPQVYMNNSGMSAAQFKNFYKIANENIIVVHDDIDLPFGKIKKSFGSGSAGHKGVESIINAISGKNFHRVRIGICPEQKPEDLENYVTKKILAQYEDLFLKSIKKAADLALTLAAPTHAHT